MSLEPLLTLADAAKLTPYKCVKTLRRAVKARKLKALQPGGKGGPIFVTRNALDAWLSGQTSLAVYPSLAPNPVLVRPYTPRRYSV